MPQPLKKGDKVKWRSGGGHAAGTVERVITGRGKVGGRTVTGSKEDPRYVVKNAETGKSVVLKRPSLQKSGARAAQRKPAKRAAAKGKRTAAKAPAKSKRGVRSARRPPKAKRKPEPEPPAATAAEATEAAALSRPAPDRRRWIAAGGIAAGIALIVVIVLSATGGDDDDEPTPAAEETTTEATTTTTTPAPSGDVTAALAARPLAIEGVGAIVAERLGDDQEARASQFQRTYGDALTGLEELEQASAGDEQISALAAYVTSEVEIERAITNAFARNSFSDGDPASVLAQKTSQTESAVQAQMREGSQLDAPPEASELQSAFAAARRANLTYLEDVAAAIDAGSQSALDQALSDGRAAATAAGRRIESAAAALQDETEAGAGTS